MRKTISTRLQNGEITDPPESAITTSTAPLRYASERRSISPGPSSPGPPSSASEIFCKKCVENQHMYQSMLAQYLPDSESDPEEYERRERDFYKFKRSVEARYPQVCEECRPRVHAALNQAGYRAKADHLRRMMDRTRIKRTTQRTWLDYLDFTGRSLWVLGLLLQLLWHLALVSSIIGEPVSLLGDREDPPEALLPLRKVSEALPHSDTFSYYSIAMSVASLWWNPQFMSTFRGFTSHINGLRNWYAFQVVIVASRMAFLQLSVLKSRGGSNRLTRLLTLHTVMALFTIFIYSVARRAVTKDHTPLFGKAPSVTATPTKMLEPPSRNSQPRSQDLSQILDEVLQGPPSALPSSPLQSSHGISVSPVDSRPLGKRRNNRVGSDPPGQVSGFGFSGMSIGNGQPKSNHDTDYGEEMEWTPTTSPYRAFNTSGNPARDSQKFNASPTGPDKGPFWYKVPPKPLDPASRLRNPPKPPLIRLPVTDLNQPPQPPFGRDVKQPHGTSIFGRKPGGQSDSPGLNIAEPSFFAKSTSNDPRNELSGLFGQSFSLSADDETEEEDGMRFQRITAKKSDRMRKPGLINPYRFAFAEVITLIGCLAAWAHTIWSPPASSPVSLSESPEQSDEKLFSYDQSAFLTSGIMGVCLVLAGRFTYGSFLRILASRRKTSRLGVTLQRAAGRGGNLVVLYVAAVLGIAEVIAAAYCAYQILLTEGGISCANEGVYLLGAMVVHRLLYAFL